MRELTLEQEMAEEQLERDKERNIKVQCMLKGLIKKVIKLR